MEEIRVETCMDCGIVHEVEIYILPDYQTELMLCDSCRQTRLREDDPDPCGLEDYAMSLFQTEGGWGG
jgi:hypothetical protein